MKKKITLFLILDAFRRDYINETDTPTLYKLTKESIYAKKLKSSSGFTQRSSIFTGTWPKENNNFTMFKYDKINSQYKYLKFFPFLKYVEFNWSFGDKLIRLILRKINKYFYKGKFFPPSYIPFNLLPKIGITEDEIPIYKPGAFKKPPIQSIFDSKFDFEFLMHPLAEGNDNWVYKKILKSKLENGIIFGQFSDSDGGIHETGVNSKGALDIIKNIDNKLKNIINVFNTKYEEYEFIIIGDHGMTNINKTLDANKYIIKELKKYNLKFGKDYFTFLSSTLVHFWWENNSAKKAIRNLMETPFFNENGSILNKEQCSHYKIPYGDKIYGNLIWAANNKVLVYPDYFHRYKVYKAMHGYITDNDDMKGFALVYNNKKKLNKKIKECNLIDICPTISDSIGIQIPKNNNGKSLFNY